MKRDNIVKWSVISIFILLYTAVSLVSTIHVIDFFKLSNPEWLAIALAITFEIGAAASLAAIVILDKTNRALVWALFSIITLMQMMGNLYYAYTHVEGFQSWSELFGLIEEDQIYQKRWISIVSGAILPLVALGFIKSLVDYIRPTKEVKVETIESKEEDLTPEDIEIEESEEIPQTEEALNEEPEGEAINESESQVIQDKPEEIAEKEKIKRTEEKIAKVIAKNPEIKKQIEEKLREIETEDKYTKTETIENQNFNDIRVVTSGM